MSDSYCTSDEEEQEDSRDYHKGRLVHGVQWNLRKKTLSVKDIIPPL
jgi:hypothetical protein